MQSLYQSPVSILVLLDDSLEVEKVIGARNAPILFQSLFSWMIRSKRPGMKTSRLEKRVSILVLLDDSLEARTSEM